ncbi:Tetratricopeptide repeat protein [Candidatus Koribacter versatilis Ellin345]|uniref:Tetratricopeptide repeat protein n=1 Tax=Koribacter versatilis (strain Ellin345) TaxID=204669 RepID=Q1IM47_KORVE|nr:tetratricopeptide repeat protein [Candidatus Koribacter versatilis]ABF42053.1 Tetratricopeptide repeat protein [Candidatus Koribacter versatilis Ellin345]
MKCRFAALGALLFLNFASSAFALDKTAEDLMNAGHYKRARAIAQQRLQKNANDADALYILARVSLAQDRLDQAQSYSERAIEIAPNMSEAHRVLGESLGLKAIKLNLVTGLAIARRGKKEGELALQLDPRSIDAAEFLASYYNAAPAVAGGGHDKAEHMVETIMQLNPGRSYLARATGAEEKKDVAGEEQWLLKAAQVDPKNYEVQDRLAHLYIGSDRHDLGRAAKYARAALALDAGRSGSYAVLAAIYAEQNRWADLDAMLSLAERADGDDLVPYFEAGKALVATGKDNARAERYLKKYLAQEAEGGQPHQGHAHWQLGLLMLREGKKEVALAELQTSVSLLPDFRPAADDLKRARAS